MTMSFPMWRDSFGRGDKPFSEKSRGGQYLCSEKSRGALFHWVGGGRRVTGATIGMQTKISRRDFRLMQEWPTGSFRDGQPDVTSLLLGRGVVHRVWGR